MQPKLVRDPLGNSIQIPFAVSASCGRSVVDLQRVVTSPAFIIQMGGEKLYFIRLLDWEFNVMVEANADATEFVVQACTINPTAEDISLLLEKGRLIPFL